MAGENDITKVLPVRAPAYSEYSVSLIPARLYYHSMDTIDELNISTLI
jgi:hypothetical protein